MDIVDLRAETNAINLARDQGTAYRKSSESQTDAAEASYIFCRCKLIGIFQINGLFLDCVSVLDKESLDLKVLVLLNVKVKRAFGNLDHELFSGCGFRLGPV